MVFCESHCKVVKIAIIENNVDVVGCVITVVARVNIAELFYAGCPWNRQCDSSLFAVY